MMEDAGFSRCEFHNMTGGVVALHKGVKASRLLTNSPKSMKPVTPRAAHGDPGRGGTRDQRALALAPTARPAGDALSDCVFAVHCTAPPLDVYLQPGSGLRLMGIHEGPVTTSVRGSLTLPSWRAQRPPSTLINGRIELKGTVRP